jgi:hypothetical protein
MHGFLRGENKAEGGIGWGHDGLQIGETSVPHSPFPDATSSAEQKWNLEAVALLEGRELQRVPVEARPEDVVVVVVVDLVKRSAKYTVRRDRRSDTSRRARTMSTQRHVSR